MKAEELKVVFVKDKADDDETGDCMLGVDRGRKLFSTYRIGQSR